MADLKAQLQQQQTSTSRPIPGQSLTNNPENPMPFEKPPKFVDFHQASEYLWVKMIEDVAYVSLMESLENGVPVMDVVQIILKQGFQQGLWNPDLMIMLIEPAAYMLIALAEKADIEFVVYQGQMDDEDDEEEILGVSFQEERIREMMEVSESGNIPANVLTDEMRKDIEKLPPKEDAPSSMAPTEAPVAEAPAQQESLMAPPQV